MVSEGVLFHPETVVFHNTLPTAAVVSSSSASLTLAAEPTAEPTVVDPPTTITVADFSSDQGKAADLGEPLSVGLAEVTPQLTAVTVPSPPETLEVLPEFAFGVQAEQKSSMAAGAIPPTDQPAPLQGDDRPVPSSPPPIPITPAIQTIDTKPWAPLPVGIMVGDRTVIPSTLVRGQEDGKQAIDFNQWLISLDDFVKALKFNQRILDDGGLELRSLGLAIRLPPDVLRQDPELGTVLPIEIIQTRFNIPTRFDLREYAIRFEPPWLGRDLYQASIKPIPVITEGLPIIPAPTLTLTAIQAETNITGERTSKHSATRISSTLTALGTLAGGGWVFKLSQANLLKPSTWQLSELQFLHQTPTHDFVFGSHAPFWASRNGGNFWGATWVQRQGFTTTSPTGGGFDAIQRIQAGLIGRTVSGEAEPGTLVQLVEGASERVIADTLVDTSSIYRFENIPSSGSYRLLLYPNGRLTAQPIVRTASFITLPTQLPAGTSVVMISTGLGRQFQSPGNWLGQFTNWRSGLLYRRGISEDLTVGLGLAYDHTLLGLAELFYQPTQFPLQLTAKTWFDPNAKQPWQLEANLRWQPSQKLGLNLSHDHLSQRATLDWQLNRDWFFNAKADSREHTLAAGLRFSRNMPQASLFASVDWNTKNEWRWNLRGSWGRFIFSHLGTAIGTSSELSYRFLPQHTLERDSTLRLNYETRNLNDRHNQLATLSWRYRSPSHNGRVAWELELGYGLGSQGQGIMASIGTGLIPGIILRARYQGVALDSDRSSFRIEISPSFQVQNGLKPANSTLDSLRSLGGIQVIPFFDRNANAQHDSGEDSYTDDSNLLLVVNNQPITALRPDVSKHDISLHLPPGRYRLDIDPAGLPVDWQAPTSAYGVEVVAGSYTPVWIPLIRSYTISGIVKDATGIPLANRQVQASSTNGKQKVISVSNAAGVFFLEGLSQGTYQLTINGHPAFPDLLTLDSSSPQLKELDIQQR